MNKMQRAILYVTSIAVLLMVLFPPYVTRYRGESLTSGYAFIFSLPKSIPGLEGEFSPAVNAAALVVQIAGIAVAGLLAFWASKNAPHD